MLARGRLGASPRAPRREASARGCRREIEERAAAWPALWRLPTVADSDPIALALCRPAPQLSLPSLSGSGESAKPRPPQQPPAKSPSGKSRKEYTLEERLKARLANTTPEKIEAEAAEAERAAAEAAAAERAEAERAEAERAEAPAREA